MNVYFRRRYFVQGEGSWCFWSWPKGGSHYFMLIVALGYIFLNVLLQTSTPTPPGNLSPVPKPIMKHLSVYHETFISLLWKTYKRNTKGPNRYRIYCIFKQYKMAAHLYSPMQTVRERVWELMWTQAVGGSTFKYYTTKLSQVFVSSCLNTGRPFSISFIK